MPKLNQQLQLSDGRKLAYNEYGPLNGKPLFYFHGSPGSRLEAPLYVNEDMLQSLDVRLIAMDRPGMGLSDFQPNRRLLDFPNDLLALADHLGVERFSILAYSLGGPYGFACAFAIPERLHKVGIVSGAALFSEPELVKNINEGTRGAFHESLITVTDYGFHLQDIQTPVMLWHGEDDKNIPVEMARFAAAATPKCEAKFYPNEGHLSLFKKHAEEIVRALTI